MIWWQRGRGWALCEWRLNFLSAPDKNSGDDNADPVPRLVQARRKQAGSAEIPKELGKIVAMLPCEPSLYLIADKGVVKLVTANAIDPEQTNINLPNFIQSVDLHYGSDDLIIQRTMCLAAQLFDETHLPLKFDRSGAISVILSAAKELASVSDVIRDLGANEAAQRIRAENGELKLDLIPHTINLKGKMDQGIASLRRVVIDVGQLCRMFFPKIKDNDLATAALSRAVEKGDDEQTKRFVRHALDVMRALNDHRNAMIHPDDQKSVTYTDFSLRPDGNLVCPTIEIRHPRSALKREDAAAYLASAVGNASLVFEGIAALLCELNVRQFANGFVTHVVRLSENELRQGSAYVWQTSFADGLFPPDQETPRE